MEMNVREGGTFSPFVGPLDSTSNLSESLWQPLESTHIHPSSVSVEIVLYASFPLDSLRSVCNTQS